MSIYNQYFGDADPEQSLDLFQIIFRSQKVSIWKKKLLSVFSYSGDTFLSNPGPSGILGSCGKQNTALTSAGVGVGF